MPTTTLRSYPYPSLSSAPDVPADISALALALDTDIGAFHAAWASYTMTWTATTGTPSVGGAGTNVAVRTVIGKTVHVRARLTFASGLASGTGAWTYGLPFTANHSSGRVIGAWTYTNSGDRYVGFAVTASPTTFQLVYGNGPTTGVGVNIPVGHAVGDILDMSLTYERT